MIFSFRPFTRHTWIDYNGAEPFEDGSVPLFAEIQVVDKNPSEKAHVIWDNNGITVFYTDDGFNLKIFPMSHNAVLELRDRMFLEDLHEMTIKHRLNVLEVKGVMQS